MAKSYIWDTAASGIDEHSRFGPRVLVEVILTRCDDVSPTVRLRGLTALYDLLEMLDENAPSQLIDTFFHFAMGDVIKTVKTPNTPMRASNLAKSPIQVSVNKTVSIIDLLRIRCYDEKPMVRAKAIQALGQALSMQWPKNFDGELINYAEIMYLTKTDLQNATRLLLDGNNAYNRGRYHSPS